jgi:hypothetical protein
MMRAAPGEADDEHFLCAAPRMQHRPAPAGAMGVDQFVDRRVDAALRERGDDEIALPGAIFVGLPMLDGAAATGAEISADRIDPVRARLQDGKNFAPLAPQLHLDAFARQGIGNKYRADRRSRDPVPAMTQVVDHEPLDLPIGLLLRFLHHEMGDIR